MELQFRMSARMNSTKALSLHIAKLNRLHNVIIGTRPGAYHINMPAVDLANLMTRGRKTYPSFPGVDFMGLTARRNNAKYRRKYTSKLLDPNVTPMETGYLCIELGLEAARDVKMFIETNRKPNNRPFTIKLKGKDHRLKWTGLLQSLITSRVVGLDVRSKRNKKELARLLERLAASDRMIEQLATDSSIGISHSISGTLAKALPSRIMKNPMLNLSTGSSTGFKPYRHG